MAHRFTPPCWGCAACEANMVPNPPQVTVALPADPNEAADLLEGLEVLREELGSVADELIELLRQAGVTPPPEQTPSTH